MMLNRNSTVKCTTKMPCLGTVGAYLNRLAKKGMRDSICSFLGWGILETELMMRRVECAEVGTA